MRLKTLRKDRPIFEIEGVVVNGNRIDLTSHLTRPNSHRSNTAFALPTSLRSDSSMDRTHPMSARSHPQILSSYQAIETAYREQGIRIRLASQQQSEKKSNDNLRRHSAFCNRNPSRTSSVLHYTTTTTTTHLNHQPDSRPFSALQQTSSNDFEQNHGHNVSYAQSLQIDEENYPTNFLSPSITESEHSICSPSPPPLPLPSRSSSLPIRHLPEKLSLTTSNVVSTTTATSQENDPDFAYMCALLSKPSGDSFRETIRRRAGLRDTFAVHRHPLSVNSVQSFQSHAREKPTNMFNRKDIGRMESFAVLPTPSAKKIDKDIIKHASRIRRISSSKEQLNKSLQNEPIKIKRNSTDKSMKSISLEPLEYLLAPKNRSASFSSKDIPSLKSPHQKTLNKRSQSAKRTHPAISIFNTEQLTTSMIFQDESLTLMRTSPIDFTQQSNSFDSGCYDHSSSGDLQSLTSSSIMQIPSSIPSVRLNCSATRRSNSTKRVSFYEEPAATYV